MKRFISFFILTLFICSNLGLAQLVTIDAEKDAFWGSLTGPGDGYVGLPVEAAMMGEPYGPEDISALCWIGWDMDFLYFYAEVTDDIIQVNNATIYENDCIELKIDPDPTMETTTGVAAVRLSAWGEDDADVPEGVDNIDKGAEIEPGYTFVDGEDYARKEVDTDDRYGYNLEFRLPWEVIIREGKEVAVDVGEIFGLAINVMDNDIAAREKQLQWSAGMTDPVWANPQLHGTATFLADNKIQLDPVNSAGGPDPVADPAWFIPPAQNGGSGDGPNLLAGGNMEDADAWYIFDMGSTDISEYEFNFTGDLPTGGSGGCLNVFGGPTGYTNILFWQDVTLEGGKTYRVGGYFKDNSPALDGHWCELYISLEEPVEGVDWTPPAGANTDVYLSMNTWEGCGPLYDGSFKDGSCKGYGELYTAPGEGEVSVIFGIKTGLWGDNPTLDYDILIDDVFLVEVGAGSAVEQKPSQMVDSYRLLQNYPNPFNPSTTIEFGVKNQEMVDLSIYDILGRKVKNLVSETLPGGQYSVSWDGTNQSGALLPSGMYIYRMRAGSYQEFRKLTFVQ